MGLRQVKRRIKVDRQKSLKRFERQRRINMRATPGPHDFIVVLDHLKVGYNIGKIFRSADAFGACEIHLIGIDFFDPAPAKGSFKYVPTRYFETFADCHGHLLANQYKLFILDPSSGDSLMKTALPARSAFVFGHEEFGFSFNRRDFPRLQAIRVPQFGRVQSLNVSVAASLAMYEYVRQHKEP